MTFEFSDLSTINAWVLDVDGCLVRTEKAGGSGGTAIEGAVEFVQSLHDAGHAVRVVTNASQKSPRLYAQHLRDIGFNIKDEHFMTAGSAAAAFLANRFAGGKILVLGEDGLHEPLTQLDMQTTSDNPEGVVAVVVGAVDVITATQLNAACIAVADNNAELFVTVDTPWFYGGKQRSICVSAAVAHSISWVTGVVPQVLGKPSLSLGQTLCRELGEGDVNIAVVGDAPAEITLAKDMGARSITVLTGALTLEKLNNSATQPEGLLTPDLVANSVAELIPHISTKAVEIP